MSNEFDGAEAWLCGAIIWIELHPYVILIVIALVVFGWVEGLWEKDNNNG